MCRSDSKRLVSTEEVDGKQGQNKTNRETKRGGVKWEGRNERERGWAHPIIFVFFKKTKKTSNREFSDITTADTDIRGSVTLPAIG